MLPGSAHMLRSTLLLPYRGAASTSAIYLPMCFMADLNCFSQTRRSKVACFLAEYGVDLFAHTAVTYVGLKTLQLVVVHTDLLRLQVLQMILLSLLQIDRHCICRSCR